MTVTPIEISQVNAPPADAPRQCWVWDDDTTRCQRPANWELMLACSCRQHGHGYACEPHRHAIDAGLYFHPPCGDSGAIVAAVPL